MEKDKEKIDPEVRDMQPKAPRANLHRNSTWVVKSRASTPKGVSKLSTGENPPSPREPSGNKRAVSGPAGGVKTGNRCDRKCNTCGKPGHLAKFCKQKKTWKASAKNNRLVAEQLVRENQQLEGSRDAFDELGDIEKVTDRLEEVTAELEELRGRVEERQTEEEIVNEGRNLAIALARRDAVKNQIANIVWDRPQAKGLPRAALAGGLSALVFLLLRSKFGTDWKRILVHLLKCLGLSVSVAVSCHVLDMFRRWWFRMAQWHHPPQIECGFKFERMIETEIGGDGRPDALSPCDIVHEDPKLAEIVYYEEAENHHLESVPFVVSLEAAAQVAHHANLSPLLQEETVATKVDMALGKLMTMNQDRFSYVGPDNLITATSRLVYGIRKSGMKKAEDNGLPFWKASDPAEPWDMATDTGRYLLQSLALSRIATSAWSNTTGKGGLLYMLVSDLISKGVLSHIRTRMM